ncbi:cyclin-like protein [Nitzschia inconspicua]|uniref:Cyclin-like protein n=1 Tax=Nitzschia inconspicua TaxID=303405 RepID=A0A9K3KMU3_9STRA|nr:cyclin-like protein [Nitzschia inconspicua]
MEKELFRNLKIAAIKNPSRSQSIFHSFVTDLSFWDVEGDSTSSSGLCSRLSGHSGYSRGSKRSRSKIPSWSEAMAMHDEERKEAELACSSKTVWKSAVDPATGKTYYYDAVTRKTQWHKPPEVKAMERRAKAEKRRLARIFFDEMEKNLVQSLARGELIPGIPREETKDEGSPKEPLPKCRVRTISGMDDVLLAELRGDYCHSEPVKAVPRRPTDPSRPATITTRQSSAKSNVPIAGRPPLPVSRQSSVKSVKKNDEVDDLQLSPDLDENTSKQHRPEQPSPRMRGSELAGVQFLDAPIHDNMEWRQIGNEIGTERVTSNPTHARRNTGGTIYLQHTMINPDIKATIKCVCGVFRAHIVEAGKQDRYKHQKLDKAYDVFNDDYGSTEKIVAAVPSLSDVVDFYDAFYRRSQMEHDTIITSLIYLERVIKSTNGALTPNPKNWRSLLFSCMVLASKVWDDLSMWNVDFSNVSAHTAGLSSYTLRRINQLEIELLQCLKFDVKVPASEYAKYYFLIRTMLLRSGLVKEDEKPLRKRDAFRKLETLTRTYLKDPPERISRDRRCKSMDDSMSTVVSKESMCSGPVLKDSICLEQLLG